MTNVDPDADTQIGNQEDLTVLHETSLAWDQAEPPSLDPYTPKHSRAMIAALSVLVFLLASVVLVGLITLFHHPSESTPAVPRPPPVYVPPPVVPSPTQQLPVPPTTTPTTEPPPTQTSPPPPTNQQRDQQFLQLMAQNGIHPVGGNPRALINAAHTICNRLAQGEPENQIVKDVLDGSGPPPLSFRQAQILTDTAINMYCSSEI